MTSLHPCFVTQAPGTVTNYRGIGDGNSAWGTTESDSEGVLGGTGNWTFDNWTVTLATAPGGTSSWTFTVRKNEADTACTVTISGAATSATYSGAPVTFAPGDRIALSSVPTNSPAAPATMFHVGRWTGGGQPWISSSANGTTQAANVTRYFNPMFYGSAAAETGTGGAACPCPTAGTISALYLDLQTDPGSGKTVVATLRVNKVSTALTCTVTGNGSTAKTANDTSHSVAVAAGDLVDWQIVTAAGSTTTRCRLGALFAPTIDGEGVLIFPVAATQNATLYYPLNQLSNATESARQVKTQMACTVKKLFVDATGAAPASGQTVTWTFRQGGAATSLTVAITGTGTASAAHGSDTTHTVAVAAADLVDLQSITTATTGTVQANAGVVIVLSAAALDWLPEVPDFIVEEQRAAIAYH